MTIEEALRYCREKELTVRFTSTGVYVKDEGFYDTETWDIYFVEAVEQMKAYLEAE